MARKLWIIAVIALLLTSCTRTRTSGVQSQGQTHWWRSCDTNADCGEQTDLSCICSVCMAECGESGSSCEVEGRQTECFVSNTDAVQTLCGAAALPAAAAVCLETCESECGDGFRCEAGACIAIEPPPQPMAGRGEAGTGAAGSGAAGTGEQDGGQSGMPVTIELVNGTSSVLHAQTQNCTANPAWFQIFDGDEQISPFLYCATDCATNPTGPQGCPAICLAPKFESLQPNDSIRFEWDGMTWVGDPRGCANHIAVAESTPLVVKFCWLTEQPAEIVPGVFEQPSDGDLTCASIDVTIGAAPILYTIGQ